ncbi:MAG TPA: hypothetical protein PLH94_11640 [Fimbriimonadaceae bacterium]|nr:hypothetical protein [Fimbriimonadaceae bacterium]
MLVRFALQVVAGSVALAPVAAFAPATNDAALNWGGTPKLMDAHPTVRMVDEKITIVVGADMTTADCRFTFRNDGPACTVRMGFPDRADGAADPDEELTEEEMKAPPKRGGMERFQSWVNGREVLSRWGP